MRTTPLLPLHPLVTATATLLIAAASLGACGGTDGAADIPLTAAGEAGRDIIRSNGCAACHGRNGEGRPGPSFVGLYGSTVEFKDGDSTVVDDDYIYESITDPKARLVKGFGFPMPENDLDDDQIEQVIAFIRDLATPTDDTEEAGS